MIPLNEIMLTSIYLSCVHVYKKLTTYIKGRGLKQADCLATFLYYDINIHNNKIVNNYIKTIYMNNIYIRSPRKVC